MDRPIDTLKRMQVARTTLLLDHPFFGVLALGLQLVEDTGCGTAWTNGQSLGYDPAFIATLTADQLVGLIAHEVMHCAAGHPWRRDAREPKKWNVACDHAINHILTGAGLVLPPNGLQDPAFAGKWAEWIYDRLPDTPQPGQAGAGTGTDPGLDVRDAPTDSDAPTQEEWQQNVKQASNLSRGSLSSAQLETIDNATRHREDWRSLLRRYTQDVSKADYSWSRPNVRYIPSGLYLPSLHTPSCGRLAIAIDTSGSIDAVLLGQFAAELRAIADELQPASIDVIYCDTKVHRVDRFDRGDDIDITVVGRGGTSFVPVFDSIAQSGDTPVCLIYFTDLDGRFPDTAPDYPVIWAAYNTRRNQVAPFGDTVECA